LVVNIASALILHDGHGHTHGHEHEHDYNHAHEHEHEHGHVEHVHDHNLRSAFFHVVLDAVTAVLAIVALLLAKLYHLNWLDPAVGIVGAIVILVWAVQLLRDAGSELLDRHCPTVSPHKLRSVVETEGVRILDCHVWRIAPKAIACELVVSSPVIRGHGHYRELLQRHFSLQHVLIEERSH
jgi:cation diffusion facilitator family transporter